MVAGIAGHTSAEIDNVALGNTGTKFYDTTDALTGADIRVIEVVTDATFTTLTPETAGQWAGTSGGAGNNIDTGNTFPAGFTLRGRWTAMTLNGGSVVVTLGNDG